MAARGAFFWRQVMTVAFKVDLDNPWSQGILEKGVHALGWSTEVHDHPECRGVSVFLSENKGVTVHG